MDSRHCDCSAYDVPRKWRGSRSSSSGRLPFHPLPASPEVRWAEEVDDDIACLLGESYQDWRQGKRRRAICAQMNSRGGTRRRGEFVDLAPWPALPAQGERGLEGRNRGAVDPRHLSCVKLCFLLSRHHSQHSTTTPPIHPSRLHPPLPLCPTILVAGSSQSCLRYTSLHPIVVAYTRPPSTRKNTFRSVLVWQHHVSTLWQSAKSKRRPL
jgi:hypothetical protein